MHIYIQSYFGCSFNKTKEEVLEKVDDRNHLVTSVPLALFKAKRSCRLICDTPCILCALSCQSLPSIERTKLGNSPAWFILTSVVLEAASHQVISFEK